MIAVSIYMHGHANVYPAVMPMIVVKQMDPECKTVNHKAPSLVILRGSSSYDTYIHVAVEQQSAQMEMTQSQTGTPKAAQCTL